MRRVKVVLTKRRRYEIIIGHKIITHALRSLKRLRPGKNAILISNPSISSIHKKVILKISKDPDFTTSTIMVPDKETSKSYGEVVRIIDQIVKLDKGKGVFIIALGGGVVGDVAGFVASIYKRGIPYIQIPTTLLAQADSAIGGKVAIDLTSGKNLVGAFYQPSLVISDIALLESLPPRQVRSGLAEIIKYGIIEDRALFKFIEANISRILKLDKGCLEHIIYRSSRIKAGIVQRDEFDTKGIRAKLNYGHTIGHAIEAASSYSKAYSHGEAIAIGMVAAAEIAARMSILKKAELKRIWTVIKKAGLPVRIPQRLKREKIIKALMRDKKIVRGVNRFILPVKIGKVRIFEDIPKRLILDVLRKTR